MSAPPDPMTGQRTVAVAVLGLVVFNYPLLAVVDTDTLVLGVPLLWFSLFASWVGLVAVLALVVRRG